MPIAVSLLMIAAFVFATAAALRWHSISAQQPTFWDVATVLLFRALGTDILSDPAAEEADWHAKNGPAAAHTRSDARNQRNEVLS